jgi:hypothetical protein
MSERNEFVTNTLLLLAVLALAASLAWNAVRTPRGTEIVIGPGPLAQPTPEVVQLASVEKIFDERDIFADIIPPRPTPTPVVLPMPTPTPREFAKWTPILFIGDSVQIRDAQGRMHYLREGESLEGVRLVEVVWEEETLLVRNEGDGREKRLKKGVDQGGGRNRSGR